MISRSTLVKLLINSLVGIIAIFIWLKFVNLGEIVSAISRANLLLLLPAFLFSLLSVMTRAYRLKFFLKPVKNISFKELVFLSGASTMLNFLIPIRAGDISKAGYLAHVYKLSVSHSLVWVFIDRFIDFLVLFVSIPVFFVLIPTNLGSQFIIVIIAISLALIVVSSLMVFQKNLAQKLFEFLSMFLIFGVLKRYFKKVYSHFLDSFSILKRPAGELGALFMITLLAFAFDGLIWFFVFLSLGSFQNYLKMLLGQLLSALTYLIPAAPGYVGSAEASGLLVLSGVLGIEQNLASAMIVLFHITIAIFVLILGLISIFSLKLDLGLVLRKALKRG